MLGLPYNATDVPPAMIESFEHHGRCLGVPLDALERIGQSLDLVEEFIVAAEGGYGVEYADAVQRGEEYRPALVRLAPATSADRVLV